MAEPFDHVMIRDVVVYTGASTTPLTAGRHLGQVILPAGYIYYLEDAYAIPDTTVATATGGANGWLVVDESGNTIGTIASGSALAVTGTAFASLSSTYRELNAKAAAKTVYIKYVQSGDGATPPYCVRFQLRFSVRRPA